MKIVVSGCAVLALWAGIGPGAAQDQATTSAPAAATDPLVGWARILGDTKGGSSPARNGNNTQPGCSTKPIAITTDSSTC
jgi:hypothetical protein